MTGLGFGEDFICGLGPHEGLAAVVPAVDEDFDGIDELSRDIQMIIIDGKNLCFEGNTFIGLAALIPLTEQVAKRYDVTVVFDASIRRDLKMSDDQLAKALPAAKVHVVASRAKADETILDAAHESTAWVISNDRYGDYRDTRHR